MTAVNSTCTNILNKAVNNLRLAFFFPESHLQIKRSLVTFVGGSQILKTRLVYLIL